MKYEGNWKGLDRGREGLLDPDAWLGILHVLSRHEGESIRDPEADLYAELETRFPETEWISSLDPQHNFFRDYQTPWTLAGVLVPTRDTDGVIRLTALGRALIAGRVSARAVWIQAMAGYSESNGDKSFVTLASAFLSIGNRQLTLQQIYFGIETGWRTSDGNVATVLNGLTATPAIDATPARRLRQILKLMTTYGALISDGNTWQAGNEDLLRAIASGETVTLPGVDIAGPAIIARPPEEQVIDQLAGVADTLPLPLREKVLRAISVRRGQPQFRKRLLGLYDGRCAISRWDADVALEAAHIVPIATDGDHDATNGLLLRADLHTLFDLHYIGVDPAWAVVVAPFLSATRYQEFSGTRISLPLSVADRPSTAALQLHLQQLIR